MLQTFEHVLMHCIENSKHIFPEIKLCGLVPNFYFYVYVSDLYIPTIGPRQTDPQRYMDVEIGRQNITILFWK